MVRLDMVRFVMVGLELVWFVVVWFVVVGLELVWFVVVRFELVWFVVVRRNVGLNPLSGCTVEPARRGRFWLMSRSFDTDH